MPDSFPLTPELLEQIIYGMENQKDRLVLDPGQRVLLSEQAARAEDREFLALPDWKPADGFQLMERFTSSLNNPLFRERLGRILHGGQGVFRHFKNALKERPDIERLWYAFKEREMRRRVVEWYGGLVDAASLEALGEEPEILDHLVLADMSLREAGPEGPEAVEKLRALWRTESPDFAGGHTVVDPASPKRIILAETPGGETAGALVLRTEEGTAPLVAVEFLYVREEYRGLGLAREFLDRSRTVARESGARELRITIPADSSFLERNLEERGYAVRQVVWGLAGPAVAEED